jgi:hypothetical protein
MQCPYALLRFRSALHVAKDRQRAQEFLVFQPAIATSISSPSLAKSIYAFL